MTIQFNEGETFYRGKLPIGGLVDFMQRYGSVWYGNLTRKEFAARFHRRMFSMLSELADLDNIIINQNYKVDQIRFNMDLATIALKIEKWYWPGVAYDYVNWPTGNTRLFATGLTHTEPWKDLPVLAICQTDCPDFLDDPVEITNDDQLNQLLGFRDWASPGLVPEVFLELTPDEKFSITFREVDPYLDHKHSTINRFEEFVEWSQQNKSKIKLGIYTNWPENISDSFDYWDYEILGNSPWTDPKRPGTLEKAIVNPAWPDDIDYLLFVVNPMHIDLSQFLLWMDAKNFQFADMNWRFTLISKKAHNKTSKTISIADIQSMKQ